MSGSSRAGGGTKTNDPVEDWAEGARALLRNTAEAAGFKAPERVLDEPEDLVEVFNDVLASTSKDDLSDQELITLTTQLAALAAQVLHIESGAVWMRDDDPESVSSGAFVLTRPGGSDDEPYRFDPFLYAMSEINSSEPDVRRYLDEARTMISWERADAAQS